MEQVLLVVQVIITLALIVMVLIQRSDSDGFGLSGGSGGNILSGRATANLMTRTTAILAAMFMANALLLGVIASHHNSGSIVETIQEQQKDEKGLPVVPAADATKSETKADEKASAPKEEPAAEKKAPSVPAADDVKPVEKVIEKAVEKEAAAPADEAAKEIKKVVKKAKAFDPNEAPTEE